MVDFVSFLKAQDWLRVFPGRAWPPPSTATTIVERVFSERPCTFSCVGNLIHNRCKFEFTIGGCYDSNGRILVDSNSSGSDESSVSRQVRHRIERGGRIESYTTDEVLCSFALVKHTKKVNLASENYGETSATAKENRENSAFNHGEQHQATGLYAYFQGNVCLIDHTKIMQLGHRDSVLCIDMKHYVHLEIAFPKTHNENRVQSIYQMLLESLSSKSFIPREGWYDSHIPSSSSSGSHASNSQLLEVAESGTPAVKQSEDDVAKRSYKEFLQLLHNINNVPCPYDVNWYECRNNTPVSARDDTQTVDLYEKELSKLILAAGHSFGKYKTALRKQRTVNRSDNIFE
eukprot:g12383.t1